MRRASSAVIIAAAAVVLGMLIGATEVASGLFVRQDYAAVVASTYGALALSTLLAGQFEQMEPWLLAVGVWPLAALNLFLVIFGYPNHLLPLALYGWAMARSLKANRERPA